MTHNLDYTINMPILIRGLRDWQGRRTSMEAGTDKGLSPVTKVLPEAITLILEHFNLAVGVDTKLNYHTQVRPWLVSQLTPGPMTPMQEVIEMIILEHDYVYKARLYALNGK